jgi:hypothetical protein
MPEPQYLRIHGMREENPMKNRPYMHFGGKENGCFLKYIFGYNHQIRTNFFTVG